MGDRGWMDERWVSEGGWMRARVGGGGENEEFLTSSGIHHHV
jgi:hypothetical protein